MLDVEELKKYLFVTIMNEKVLSCFTILLQMIGKEGSYVAYLINLFIFKCNYNLKWFLVSLEERKKKKKR